MGQRRPVIQWIRSTGFPEWLTRSTRREDRPMIEKFE
jgi:hypothetical protein